MDPVKPATPSVPAVDPIAQIQAVFAEHGKFKAENTQLKQQVADLEKKLAAAPSAATAERVAQLETYMRQLSAQLAQVAGPGK